MGVACQQQANDHDLSRLALHVARRPPDDRDLRLAGGAARAATRELASQGFTALGAVWRHGPCRVSDVAHELHVDLSVASRQVRALGAAGYVVRREDPQDRRAHLVELTDVGRAVLAGAHARMVEELGDAVANWSEDEVLELAQGIERLVSQFALHRQAAQPASHREQQEEDRP